MCRSCAQRPPGGKRCENPDRRRARQRAAYHARKAATTTDTRHTEPVTAENPAPPPGDGTPVTLDDIYAAIDTAMDAVYTNPVNTWTTPDVNGFPTPTPAGLTVEQTIRDVGTLINRRAHQVAADELATHDQKWGPLLDPHRGTGEILSALLGTVTGKGDNHATNTTTYSLHLKDLTNRGEITPTEMDNLIRRAARGEAQPDLERAKILSEARLRVLSEVRAMGPHRTPLTVHEASTKTAAAQVTRVTRYLPTEWILTHNRQVADPSKPLFYPLVVTRAPKTTRAYQSDVRIIKVWKERPKEITVKAGSPIPDGGTIIEPDSTGWNNPDYVRVQLPETERYKGFMRAAVISTDLREAGHVPPGDSTALHELVHRMQTTSGTPMVDVEKVFLARRTMNGTSRAPLETYQGGKPGPTSMGALEASVKRGGEHVRPDQFTDRYVGKDYGTHHATEVAPMGFESVFTGYRASDPRDTEHEDLILGMVATL